VLLSSSKDVIACEGSCKDASRGLDDLFVTMFLVDLRALARRVDMMMMVCCWMMNR
jgi:hypothetical protein